jgi:hypothetical protein
MFKTGKSLKTESRFVAAWGWKGLEEVRNGCYWFLLRRILM